jgi:hypothetical protein
MSTTTELEDRKVRITGVLVDKAMTVEGLMGKHRTIDWAVGKLQQDITMRISSQFHLEPPLNPDDMRAKYYPSGQSCFSCHYYYSSICIKDANRNDTLGSLGSMSLTALFYPGNDQKLAIQNRIKCLTQGETNVHM